MDKILSTIIATELRPVEHGVKCTCMAVIYEPMSPGIQVFKSLLTAHIYMIKTTGHGQMGYVDPSV